MADYSTDVRLITGILPKGVAVPTLRAVKRELGVVASNINNARGLGRITPLSHRGMGGQSEKEILNVVVDADVADRAFELIYEEAGIDEPHGGMIYMSRLSRANAFLLPDLPEEE